MTTEQELPTPTPTKSILSWNETRTNTEKITTLFNQSGNFFLLDTGNMSSLFNTLHIYFGVSEGKIQLYAVPSVADYSDTLSVSFKRYIESGNGNPESTIQRYIDSKLLPVHLSKTTETIQGQFTGKPTPEEEALIKAVNNWTESGMRQSWIDQIFNEGAEGNMIQAFRIDTSDFMPGQIHACYLALNESEDGVFTIDLVIINTETNQILNLLWYKRNYNKTSQFRDMARPVPPFGQDIDPLAYTNFGILSTLNIQ